MKKILKKWLFKPLILELEKRMDMHRHNLDFASEQLESLSKDDEYFEYFTQYEYVALQRLSEVNHILEIVKKQIS